MVKEASIPLTRQTATKQVKPTLPAMGDIAI